MENTPDVERLGRIFFPYASQRQHEVRERNRRFVYYTRAETAKEIIRNKEMWMRNATCMNDFMEVEYGMKCLDYAYASPAGQELCQLLNSMFPGIQKEIAELFINFSVHFRANTYLACISEHFDSEDAYGRLSMWRAYGKESGVAIVFKNTPFFMRSQALKAYISPVAYFSAEETENEFSNISQAVKKEYDFLRVQKRNIITNCVFSAFRFAALGIKHPGFKEESEWRIIYNPTMASSTYMKKEIRVINGVPQPIYKIPLIEIPEENFIGTTIPQILDHIIIGPSQYSWATYLAFVELLAEAGVSEPDTKVIFSDIPLRR